MGYIGYDTVRYVYPNKIPFETAPEDDRGLSEMYLALYDKVIIFDNVSEPCFDYQERRDSFNILTKTFLLSGQEMYLRSCVDGLELLLYERGCN